MLEMTDTLPGWWDKGCGEAPGLAGPPALSKAEMLDEGRAGSAGSVWGLLGERGAWWGCRLPGVLRAGLLYTSQAQGG